MHFSRSRWLFWLIFSYAGFIVSYTWIVIIALRRVCSSGRGLETTNLPIRSVSRIVYNKCIGVSVREWRVNTMQFEPESLQKTIYFEGHKLYYPRGTRGIMTFSGVAVNVASSNDSKLTHDSSQQRLCLKLSGSWKMKFSSHVLSIQQHHG